MTSCFVIAEYFDSFMNFFKVFSLYLSNLMPVNKKAAQFFVKTYAHANAFIVFTIALQATEGSEAISFNLMRSPRSYAPRDDFVGLLRRFAPRNDILLYAFVLTLCSENVSKWRNRKDKI
jgi:hypothetical protein